MGKPTRVERVYGARVLISHCSWCDAMTDADRARELRPDAQGRTVRYSGGICTACLAEVLAQGHAARKERR